MNKDINEKELVLLVKEAVGLDGDVKITLLAGDASTRQYYQVHNKNQSCIAVVSEPFSNSDPSILSNYAFKELGAPVPKIIKVFPDKGVMIKEDLGKVHLQDTNDKKRLFDHYDEAVDIMLSYQLNGAKAVDKLYPLSYSFTKEKFISELNMTTEYYLKGYKKKTIKDTELKEINDAYVSLVDKMMLQKNLLLHRDYHSRNLMVKDEHLYVIDYQDARLGPYTYDLASLIIDPYIDLSEQLEDKVMNRYYKGVKNYVQGTYQEFKENYELCFLQRGIKILGTFAYQKIAKNNDRYLPYIKPSENKIKNVLKGFPQWEKTFSRILLK